MIKTRNIENLTSLNDGISNTDGCIALEAILANPYPIVLVSRRLIIDKDNIDQTESEIPIPYTQSESLVRSLSEQVKIIWSEVLEAPNISASSDFFLLGGDSLTAIQLSYKLSTSLKTNISPDLLLEYSKFEDFMLKIENYL